MGKFKISHFLFVYINIKNCTMFLRLYYIIQGFFRFFISKFKDVKNAKLYEHRMNICNNCEFNNNGICSLCGCFLKAKTKSDSHCSIGNW